MTLYPAIFTLVVLIGYAVSAGDDCAAGKADLDCQASQARRPKQCYHCSTYSNDKFCADPFNKSHPDVKTIRCEGSCAKWVRKPKHGPNQYIRTCSTNLNLQMPVSLVCMKESRPGDGHLCFCNKKACNGGRVAGSLAWSSLVLVTLSCMMLFDWLHLDRHDEVAITRRKSSTIVLVYNTDCVPSAGEENTLTLQTQGIYSVESARNAELSMLNHSLYQEKLNT